MAEVSLLRSGYARSGFDDNNTPGMELYPAVSEHREECGSPLPNPPFVFPLRGNSSDTPETTVPALNAPLSFSPSQGTKDVGVTNMSSHKSVNTLPKFDFHPAREQDQETPVSTPHSPSLATTLDPVTAPIAIPPRAGRHRRGGSEFIGGDGNTGTAALVSTSPTKSGSAPLPTKLEPPAGRRGHAHRRSGAISCHDLSAIVKPVDSSGFTRCGSAPATPSDTDSNRAFLLFGEAVVPPRSTSAAGSAACNALPNAIGTSPRSRNDRPRARVGFSDTLEFIPRPLSTISSETSSSMATLRCGHSVSGSISSLASVGTASPPSAKTRSHSLSITLEDDQSPTRPSTAGAVMAGSSERRAMYSADESKSFKRPVSAGGPTNKPTNLADPFVLSSPPTKKHALNLQASYGSSSGSTLAMNGPGPLEGNENFSLGKGNACTTSKTMFENPIMLPQSKMIKKQKNVKSWAGSILSRKSRLRAIKQKSHGRRTPTPPLRSHTAPSLSPLSNFDFGADHTGIIGDVPTADADPPQRVTRFAPLSRQGRSADVDPAMMSPVIDLDAALGPFNTPSLGAEHDGGFKGFTVAKRKMHSSGITGGFMGPGMHYHRRAESAPEMVAFDRGFLGLQRLGSNSTMADVFEEDEEEEMEHDGDVTLRSSRGADDEDGRSVGIEVVDADNFSDGKGMDWTTDTEVGSRRGSEAVGDCLSNSEQTAFESSTEVANCVASPIQRSDPVEPVCLKVVEGDEAARSSSIARSSDSSITPTLPPEVAEDKQRPPPIELGDPWLTSPFAYPRLASTAMSSPQASPTYSPSAFESPHLPTPASSFTDDYTYSSCGEPGPEYRMSVDDVPSLTSSNSTITSGVTSAGHSLSSGPYRLPGDRSGSVSSAISVRPRRPPTSKRSSLVSLSRFVGGGGSERSKLNIEEKARPDSPEKPKEKKSKRLSRMMNFLKPKKDSKVSPKALNGAAQL